MFDEEQSCEIWGVVRVEEFGEEEDGRPRRGGRFAFDEVTISMSVAKEDLEDFSPLFDLDKKVSILAVVLSWECENVVEDGGDCSKEESSSREQNSVRGFDDEVCFRVEREVGVIGR